MVGRLGRDERDEVVVVDDWIISKGISLAVEENAPDSDPV
jgi:hypothetical protein